MNEGAMIFTIGREGEEGPWTVIFIEELHFHCRQLATSLKHFPLTTEDFNANESPTSNNGIGSERFVKSDLKLTPGEV
jgi:hypothetical protein